MYKAEIRPGLLYRHEQRIMEFASKMERMPIILYGEDEHHKAKEERKNYQLTDN
jgi:hypothetical protein